MYLFINPISKISNIILFNQRREIIDRLEFEIKWNESSLLIPTIDSFLKKNNLDYFDVKNIVLVNGPWSFTWVRTAVLAINTINHITKNSLTPISYFELFDNYPIIKSSSKRDCFFKKDSKSEIEIIENEKISNFLNENNINKVYGETEIENIEIIEKIDYLSIIKEIKFQNLEKIEPLYLKKPNIC
jgi:tRNA A37 threonylcarbamoyladenosine modification protein TsaB